MSSAHPRVRYEEIQTEVAAMSEEKKNSVRQDLYGQAPIPETDDMLIDAFLRLDVEIDKIPSKTSYEAAQLLCPDYVGSVEFLRMFLRAERFDIAKAAQRIVDYWEHKVEVFGEEKAFRPISLKDFDEEDQVALLSGGFRLLPTKDSTGRGICVSHRELWDRRRTHRKSMMRLFWYIMQAAAEDHDVQRNGCVVISTNDIPMNDGDNIIDAKFDRQLSKFFSVLPVRIVGIHIIIASPAVKVELDTKGIFFAAGQDFRARYKQHVGTKVQNLDALATYGIQSDMIPPKVCGGTLNFDYTSWIKQRREQGR